MGDMLTQDEINALLGGGKKREFNGLTIEEQEELIKIASEIMRVSVETLDEILNVKTTLSSPRYEMTDYDSFVKTIHYTVMGAKIDYKDGIVGSNLLFLRERDAKIIAKLMMNVDAKVDDVVELDEIDKSALGEAMNQMVGSSSTTLAKMIGKRVDIEPPLIIDVGVDDDEKNLGSFGIEQNEDIISITYDLKIPDLVDSEIIQLIPIEFCKLLIESVNSKNRRDLKVNKSSNSNEEKLNNEKVSYGLNSNSQQNQQQNQQNQRNNPPHVDNQNNYSNNNNRSVQKDYNNNNGNVNAQSVQFQNFDIFELNQQKENIDIIMDVPLEVTVEMGKTSKKIKEILEFSPGTIIELDKLAGDPIDIMVNGKYIAKGEVVVIDENYGIRITDIISANNRI